MQTLLLAMDAQAIDTAGEWLFCLREPEASLSASVEHAGQLTPLLATEEEGRISLIDGRKRLEILKYLNCQALVMLVDAPRELDKALLRLQANQAWDLWEQAPGSLVPVLRFFLERAAAEEVEHMLPPLLGMQPRSKVWRLLWRWCDGVSLPCEWEEHLLQARLPLAATEPVLRMDEGQRQAVAPFFRELHWSVSAGREFLTLLLESAKGQGRDLQELLQQAGLPELLHEGLSPKDIMHRLLREARALRYPRKTALDRRFAELGKELTTGASWKVLPESQYEADVLYLQAKVRDQEDVLRLARELEQMAQSPGWQILAELGRDLQGSE